MSSSDETSKDTLVTPSARAAAVPELPAPGYDVGELLGRGGMGEVVRARDRRIGREVAIKKMLATDDDQALARFLREATVQARLDHPAIVPVYELGYDDARRPYFTMKRVTGTTLHDALAHATQQRLLRAVVDVGLAVELAHERGIVHRDLKPSNIMLGNYGEVYVLDWGVARVIGETELGAGATGGTETAVGALIGTVGYMSPEQARGEPAGPAADVYALGAILFEILAGEPLHPRGPDAIASTLDTPAVAPSSRRAGIPPELDAACLAALSGDPAARPSARALAERVQRYLDGDRDVERRRALAATLVAKAREALGDPRRRGEAMSAAGRAMALDPESPAAAIVSSLMLDPPRELPPALATRLAEADATLERRHYRRTIPMYLTFFAVLPLLAWQGISDPWLVTSIYAMVVLLIANSLFQSRRTRPRLELQLVGNMFLLAGLTRLYGPFMIAPAIALAMAQSNLARSSSVSLPVALSMHLGGLAIPSVFEAFGWLHETWRIEPGAIIAQSSALSIGGPATLAVLVAANLGAIVTAGWFARAMAMTRRAALHDIEIRAWHLDQLIPR